MVDGNIGDPATATKIAKAAVDRFGSIDVLVNNAGIFFTKPFADYTTEDFRALSATNLNGFIYPTQWVVKQMLAQNQPIDWRVQRHSDVAGLQPPPAGDKTALHLSAQCRRSNT